jgi:hypothetical protein
MTSMQEVLNSYSPATITPTENRPKLLEKLREVTLPSKYLFTGIIEISFSD